MMAADVSTPVLVITGSSEPFLHGVVGIVRSLGRLGVPVHVVQNAARTPVGLSRYLQRTSVVDLEVAAPQAYLQRLVEIGRALGRRPVLMPVDDVTALFVAKHAEALGEWFVFPDQPRGLSHALANKRDLHLLCARLGVPTPDAMFPESRQEVASLREALASLPAEQRRALLMATLWGYTANEISEIEGAPLGTTKSRIRSALLKLRGELGVADER